MHGLVLGISIRLLAGSTRYSRRPSLERESEGPHTGIPLLSLFRLAIARVRHKKALSFFATHPSSKRGCTAPIAGSAPVLFAALDSHAPLHIVPKHINESEEAQRTPVDTKPEATVRRSQHRTIAARLRGNTVPRCSHDSGFTLEEVFPDGGKDGRPGSLASPPDSTRDHLHL